MDGVISPKMQRKIEDIIGEALAEMSIKAQVQMLYLAKEYEQESQECSVLGESLQRRSKQNQKI